MSDTKQILDTLSGLDLSTYPFDQVKKSISQLGKFGIIIFTLHKGKTLIRARVNEDGKSFSQAKELSYKPEEYNKSYQRASTPNRTMFYAGTIPEDVQVGELNNARIISSLETSNLLRDIEKDGEQKVTFGRWLVTADIPLMAICYHKDFAERTSHSKELYEAYQTFMNECPPELQQHSLMVTEFFAREFAKAEIKGDFDYLLSATFTETVVDKGLAGVYYPSVRADALGFNVAISPEYADKNLQLIVAGECKIYKKAKHTFINNDTIAYLKEGETEFKLEEINNPDYNIPLEEIAKRINS